MVSDTIDQIEHVSARNRRGPLTRALNATPSYWLSMFAASALGTNLGDFTVDTLGAGREVSFVVLAIVAGIGIFADRRVADRTELGFWLAIVTLRAAATNVGDFLTHDLAISSILLTTASGIMTLIAGRYTRIDAGNGSPRIDARYWIAMLIAGVFGTIGGDLLSHTVGLYGAATILCSVTVLMILARQWVIGRFAGATITSYWCVVLAERGAGTPFGDALASHRAVGLGLPHAMVVTATILVGALLIRRVFRTRTRPSLTTWIFIFIAAGFSPARADWEYTHWGMTPEQVAAASSGNAKVLPKSDRQSSGGNSEIAVMGNFTSGGHSYSVGFQFDTTTGGLECVLYNGTGGEVALIKDMLVKKYGPTNEKPFPGGYSLKWVTPEPIEFSVAEHPLAGAVTHCKVGAS